MNSALVAERMVVKRNVSLGAGTTVDFDFSSIGPLSGLQTASLAGTAALPGDERSFRAQWVSGGARAVLSNSVSTLSYPLVASSARVAGDHYLAYANYDTRQGVTTGFRSASYQSQSGTGQTLNMPQPANSIQVGYLTGPVGPRPTLTWSPVSGSLLSLMATYPLTDPSAPIWEFRFSKGWIKGGSSYSYSFPDLSSLGWESRWSLRSGTPLGFYYEESATSVPFPGFYAVGSREVFADNTNWYTGIETELTLPTATKASEAHAVVTDQATPGDGILGIVRRSTTFDAIAERRFRRN
jgi:hypothetical protein